MSNYKTCIKINQIQSDKEKYILFNDFLRNLLNRKSIGTDIHNYSLSSNKINLSKYTKINGSKNFSLDSTNSLSIKEDLNENFDKVKTIMNNLEFISSNSKYMNTFQYVSNPIPKIAKENKNFFLASAQSNLPQKNLFLINKKENDPTLLKPCDDVNLPTYTKENKNELNISDNDNNTLENDYENTKIESMDKLNKIQNFRLKHQSSYRQDYYVKQFKVQYSIWIRNYLNKKLKALIAETKSCRRHLKFYPLNSLKFTANPKYEDNKYFLSLKIKDILIYGINSIKNSNQVKNKENIEIIENTIYKQNENANKDLLDFLNSTMEDSMKIFYQSEQFENFKNNKQTILNDANFVQEKNFSLLKENGFVYLIKNYKGNSKLAITFRNELNK